MRVIKSGLWDGMRKKVSRRNEGVNGRKGHAQLGDPGRKRFGDEGVGLRQGSAWREIQLECVSGSEQRMRRGGQDD